MCSPSLSVNSAALIALGRSCKIVSDLGDYYLSYDMKGPHLFIGEYKKCRIPKLVLIQHLVKFFARFFNTFAIIGIHLG